MKLILGKESEPADSITLILSQFRFDRDWDLILFGFATIKELHQECPFLVALREKFSGETWWIGYTGLENHQRG